MHPVITVTELAAQPKGASDRGPVLLDVRYRMGGPPGRPEYEAGHLPGAHYVDLETELAGAPGAAGRHPLPGTEVFTAAMRRAGVGPDRDVVVYDSWLGWGAARAWWLLRWAGHARVRVLDGGLSAWTAAGLPLETDVPADEDGDFTAVPGGLPLLDADAAAALARSGVLLDARASERYRGEVEPIDPVAGHIPGAVSAPTAENVDPATGLFLPPGDLAARFSGVGATAGTQVGVYCGSGVSGAHEVLALAAAGVPAALYVGSWSEWSRAERPVATGPQPG